MQYPLISEYVRAIQDASNNLDKLAHLVPVLDDHGEPYRSSGGFAVVFKMKDEQTGKYYALKCFTEEQEGRAEAYRQIADELDFVGSSYITSVKYLDKEIFVDSSCEEDEFPVLLMDWIDGETMENYIAENYQDNYTMAMLCYRFCKMAAWLRSQQFAHGDIKPDNIMVRPDGSLTLVDYDGMFVPAMKGQKSPTIGTKDFSHPLRTVDDFDETIDDFALASIALSLKAISLKPSLLDEYGAADRLLFSAEDYRDLSKSKVLAALQELMNNIEMSKLLSVFLLSISQRKLTLCSFRLFDISKPYKQKDFNCKVTDNDLKNSVKDSFSVRYSRDGKRLLKASETLRGNYVIRSGVEIICENAFEACDKIKTIEIPQTVRIIGSFAFAMCSLKSIIIPSNVEFVGCFAFCMSGLEQVNILKGGKSIGDYAFSMCHSLKSVSLPNSISEIGEFAFGECYALASIHLPSKLLSLSSNIFADCKSLVDVRLPNGLKVIGGSAFEGCKSMMNLTVPASVSQIDAYAFGNCESLSNIDLQVMNLETIGEAPFCGCNSLNKDIRSKLFNRFGDWIFNGFVQN